MTEKDLVHANTLLTDFLFCKHVSFKVFAAHHAKHTNPVQILPQRSSSSMPNQFYSVVVYFVPQDIQKDYVTFAEKQPL